MEDSTTEQAFSSEPNGEEKRSLVVGLWLHAVWCGFAVGLAELAIVAARRVWLSGPQGPLGVSRHFLWMIPASHLILFVASGSLLAACVCLRPRFAVVARYVLAFQAALALLLNVPAFTGVACVLLASGISYQGVRWACQPRRVDRLRALERRSLTAFAAVALGFLLLCLGRECWEEHRALALLPTPSANAPNVLLIVLDTVRADHLSAYGYSRDTSPELVRLARRGVRFEHAYATAPWTLPSHSSLLTGRWPHELATSRGKPLETNVLTLAESLAARGYVTGGIVANHYFCSRDHGLSRGFAHYEDFEVSPLSLLGSSGMGWLIVQASAKAQAKLVDWIDDASPCYDPLGFRRKSAARVNRNALRWLSQISNRPFFLFLNYFDVHDPYLLPHGARNRVGLSPTTEAEVRLLRDWATLDKSKVSSRGITLARDSYDACVAYLDQQLGRLIDALDRRKLLDNTIVIVTSDHGEHLGEHGLFGHALSVYEPEARVPLLLFYPPVVPQGRIIMDPVSLRDIPATVSHLMGARNQTPFPGSSLTRYWMSDGMPTPPVASPVVCELENIGLITSARGNAMLADGSIRALTDGRQVYVRHQSGREELFDLDTDPGEVCNLAGQPKAGSILKRLQSSMDAFLYQPRK